MEKQSEKQQSADPHASQKQREHDQNARLSLASLPWKELTYLFVILSALTLYVIHSNSKTTVMSPSPSLNSMKNPSSTIPSNMLGKTEFKTSNLDDASTISSKFTESQPSEKSSSWISSFFSSVGRILKGSVSDDQIPPNKEPEVGISDKISDLAESGKEKAYDAVSGAKKMAETVAGKSSEYFQEAKEIVGTTAEKLTQGFQEKKSEIANKASEKASEISNKATEKVSDFVHETDARASEMVNKASGKVSEAKEKGAEMAHDAREKMSEMSEKLYQMSGQAKDQVGKGVDKAKETASEMAEKSRDKASEVTDTASDLYHQARDKMSELSNKARENSEEISKKASTSFNSHTHPHPEDQSKGIFSAFCNHVMDTLHWVENMVSEKFYRGPEEVGAISAKYIPEVPKEWLDKMDQNSQQENQGERTAQAENSQANFEDVPTAARRERDSENVPTLDGTN